jgi:hypothetical protein
MPDAMLAERHIAENKNLQTHDDSPKGYIVEVDLEFPQRLRDKFKEIPPCPDSLTPKMEWFNDYQKRVATKCGQLPKTNITAQTG